MQTRPLRFPFAANRIQGSALGFAHDIAESVARLSRGGKFLSIAQGSQSIPFPAPAEALQRLDRWLGFSLVTQRNWSRRLPAVAAASLIITTYAWTSGLKPVDVRLVLPLGVLAAILGSYTDSE